MTLLAATSDPEHRARPKAKPGAALRWFHDLGERIVAEWRNAGRTDEAFVAIATGALEASPPSALVDPSAVASEVLHMGKLPPQIDIEGSFSDLPITVYDHEGVAIQVLHWVGASATVHDHSFSGAFHVLAGSSLQSLYGFRTTREHGPRVRQGVLTPLGVELLKAGDTRPIERGERLIHSVFHLEHPSISVVVRSRSVPGQPLLSYERSGLAWDEFYEGPELVRMLQSLKLHHKLRSGYVRAACTALDAADDLAVCRILFQCQALCFEEPDVQATVVGEARTRHPDLVDAVIPALTERAQLYPVLGLRERVHGDSLRHALGILLFAPTRRRALDLVAQRAPDAPPEDTLTRWAGELMPYLGPESGLDGHRLLATEASLVAFRSLLEGKSDSAVSADVADYFDGSAPLDAGAVGSLREALRASPLFRCLVTD